MAKTRRNIYMEDDDWNAVSKESARLYDVVGRKIDNAEYIRQAFFYMLKNPEVMERWMKEANNE